MNVDVQIVHDITETAVNILCRSMDEEVKNIVCVLRTLDTKLIGRLENKSVVIEAANILYFDTVDKKTFLYTKDEIYQTTLKLYELETTLNCVGFFRASKSSIVNFNHIVAIQADINERLIITLDNDERLVVSRMYTQTIKQKLGV